jgi:hypothetical protein
MAPKELRVAAHFPAWRSLVPPTLDTAQWVTPLIYQYGDKVISPHEGGWLVNTAYATLLLFNEAVSDGGVHRP